MKQPVITTERLILRPFKKDDFEAVYSYAGNIENVRYMPWGPNNEKQTKDFIKNSVKRAKNVKTRSFDYAVVLKDNNKLIGSCGFYADQAMRQAMLGWILHMDYWEKGYGTEIAKALINFGFGELKLHRVYATCHADNCSSCRVMEKSGMRYEALLKQNCKERDGFGNEWFDERIYAMLRDEWLKLQ